MSMKSQTIADFALALENTEISPLHFGVSSDPRFAAGFAVHRNNVDSARTEALRKTFPVLERLVGQEYFSALCRLFIATHPPRSAVLHEYGGALADFVQCFPPLSQMSYLADIARLEWVRLCAFHAADVQPLHFDAGDIVSMHNALMQPLRWHPSVALLQSGHPLFSLWASQTLLAEVPTTDKWRSENVLVWRKGLVLCTERVDERVCLLLRGINAGVGLSALIAQSPEQQDALLDCVARLLQWQVLCPVA